MSDIQKTPVDRDDLSNLLCLLQAYEHYGNQSVLPECLGGVASSLPGRS